MTKTCAVAGCKTNYKKQENGVKTISNPGTVIGFPDQSKSSNLLPVWIRFCNQKDLHITEHVGICIKHFDDKFVKEGKRKTLRWELNPIPTKYSPDIEVAPSLIPTTPTYRKPPTDRSEPDQLKEFQKGDTIQSLGDVTDSVCPAGYKMEMHDGKAAILYKLEMTENNIPEVTETIVIDQELHVKLYKRSIPIPLPQWFRKGSDCKVKHKSVIENFPNYIKNYGDVDVPDSRNIPSDIMDELQKLKYKKTVNDGPKYSPNMIRYALLMYYTSPQTYKMLLETLPFPSISLLKKLSQGGVEPLKACKLLLERGKMDKDVILSLDEIYIQKDAEYNGGRMIGTDADGKMFKGVVAFMINGLKNAIPFVVKAIPELKITGKWIAEHLEEVIGSLHKCGFYVRAVVCDNHSTNVSAFNVLLKKYGSKDSPDTIKHPSRDGKIYLFYDSVHLLKNVRNNLLNARRFNFPSFSFHEFYDDIDVPEGKITWKLLHDVYDRDQQLDGYLRKAPKLSYKSLHPGDNKQSVPLALNVFDRTTAIGIKEYFPDSDDASEFIKLINIWWTISNSKQQFNTNYRLGNAAVSGDNKPKFLREFADWIEKWQQIESKKSNPFSLTPQTSHALVTTLRCTASLIEDLLREGYSYVLTARFQSDPLERRFSRYRQMSGGRFLIGLRELESSERILSISSLIKEGVDFWKEDVRPSNDQTEAISWLNSKLDEVADEIDTCMLNPDAVEVSAVIAGYAARKVVVDRSKCAKCKEMALASSEIEKMENENNYLQNLSRGGLLIPTTDLRHHIAKSFAILDLCQHLTRDALLPERTAAEICLKRNHFPVTFLCNDHSHLVKFLNRTVANVFFNNARKQIQDMRRKDKVRIFKERQVKKQKTE